MSYYYDRWAPYVSVSERRKQAGREVAKLRKKGQPIEPVQLGGRRIAATFWGKAWCDNLESYRDYESRLPRGRSYVRNDSVIDLQIAELKVKALVSGSSVYTVSVSFGALAQPMWQSICRDCAGGIDSLVELLQGRFSKAVMERICCQKRGLFPKPAEIRFRCSCPDHASMCKHVAAVLYGVGSRLDDKPELLFRLRAVDHNDLVTSLDTALPSSLQGPAGGKALEVEDISALFGIDIEQAPASEAPPASAMKAKAGKSRAAEKAAPQKIARPSSKPPARKRASRKRVPPKPAEKSVTHVKRPPGRS